MICLDDAVEEFGFHRSSMYREECVISKYKKGRFFDDIGYREHLLQKNKEYEILDKIKHFIYFEVNNRKELIRKMECSTTVIYNLDFGFKLAINIVKALEEMGYDIKKVLENEKGLDITTINKMFI